MNQKLKRGIALTLVIVMMASIFSAVAFAKPAEAASAKKVTAVKNYDKAPSVKTGNTKVTASAKRIDNYVKFKAPKDGTYVITFTDLNGGGGSADIAYGTHYVVKKMNGYLSYMDVKTNKGKASSLYVTTKYCWDTFDKKDAKKPTSSFYKRTATIKLKKDETIYLASHCSCEKSKFTYKLNIKKK